MKLAVLTAILAASFSCHAQTVRVDGYFKKDGTYVESHNRTAPDQHRYNNYGAQNSIYGGNPYTGKRGSQRDEFSAQPQYNQPRQQRHCHQGLYGQTICN